MELREYTLIREYTLSDVIKILNSKPKTKASSQRDSESAEWAGAGYQDAVKMATIGDSKTFSAIETIARGMSSQNENISDCVIDTDYCVSGHTVDIDRFLSGNPECMLETNITSSNRVVNIMLNCGAWASVKPEDMQRRLSVVIAIVRALELSGYSVGLVYEIAVSMDNNNFVTRITLKEPDRYADWSVISFWACHPAALRRCWFKIVEEEPNHIRDLFAFKEGRSYGNPTNSTKSDSNTVYIPLITRSEICASDQELRQKVIYHFQRQGINITIN